MVYVDAFTLNTPIVKIIGNEIYEIDDNWYYFKMYDCKLNKVKQLIRNMLPFKANLKRIILIKNILYLSYPLLNLHFLPNLQRNWHYTIKVHKHIIIQDIWMFQRFHPRIGHVLYKNHNAIITVKTIFTSIR